MPGRVDDDDDDDDDDERDATIGALVRARALEVWDASTSCGDDAYTAFAAFVVVERDDDDDGAPRARVASWATGTKCVARRRRGARGDVLGDCHAEALARRAFRRWLCEEYASMRDGRPSVFEEASETRSSEADGAFDGLRRARMRSGVEVHAYCSQSPCGDASVFDAPARAATGSTPSTTPSREDAIGVVERSKRAKTTGSIGGGAGTTGAKIFDGATAGGGGGADSERDAATQEVGAIRWKPGRGDPSFCLSCSDKLCRWGMEGVQGKLLRHVIAEPVRLTSVCVSAPRVAEESRDETRRVVRAALERAVVRRALEGVEDDASTAPRCVVVEPHDRVGLSSYASIVAGDRVASPLSLVATGPSTSDALERLRDDSAPSSKTTTPTVERVLGAKGYRHGYSKSCVASGAAASEYAPSRYARAFARTVLSRAPPACRARFAAMSYREAKSSAPRSRHAACDANPVARRLFAPLPGKSAALDVGDFHPFTDVSSP